MSFEECSRRGVAAAVIVIAHALALYALAVTSPTIRATPDDAALAVHFISQPRPHRTWRPPQVSVVRPFVLARKPQMPLIEIPAAPVPSARAISVASKALPIQANLQDPGIPKPISAVEYVREPAPRYPRQSRRLREEGLVVLRVVIDERGRACSIDVERSSGYARLDLAAREAVQRAEFRPYVEDGAPRRAQVLIPIEFSLNRGSA